MRKHLFTLVIVFVLCLGLLSGFYYETDEDRGMKADPPISSDVLEDRLISFAQSIGSFALDSSGKVALNSGNFTSWYDRLDLSGAVDSAGSNYAQRLHSWLQENSGYQNPDGVLANPIYSGWQTSGDVVLLNGGAIYAHPIAEFVGTVGFTYTHTGDAAVDEANANGAANAALGEVMNLKMGEVMSYASAVFYALDRDNVWNFWIDGQLYCGVGASGGYSYGGGSGELSYTVTAYTYLYASDLDIRAETYRETSADMMANSGLAAEMSALDNTVEQLFTSRLSGDETRYELVEMIHDTLVNINCYNSADDLNSIPHACRTVIGGLGGTGINAPVCEGYARAFKLLCDICEIPCVLVDGLANGESHMWNYVQMENGNWYAVDATWDDPTVAGISDPVSGYENRDYFLVGSTTVIDGLSFSASHVLANNPSPTAPGFVNGPALSPTAYEPGEGEACGDNLTWVFDEATGTLTISGTGDMWDFSYDSVPWVHLRAKIISVNVQNGVTSIGCYAFADCKAMENASLPNSLTSIGDYAFNNCVMLDGVVLPEGLARICDRAFENCTSLSEINIPGSLTYGGTFLFSGCTGLKNVTIGDGLDRIRDQWFLYCSGLESLAIPDSVSAIEHYAFYGCSSLTAVDLGNGLVTIGDGAFGGCVKLTEVVIPSGVTSIGAVAFAFCGLESVVIPDTVTITGNGAFAYCDKLKSAKIPDSVTSISEAMFSGCSSLAEIVIPGTVTSIGEEAFAGCSGLESVVIPDSVTSVDKLAFFDCVNLNGVYISDLSAWCKIDFVYADSNPLYNGVDLYLNEEKVVDLTIPDDVSEIKDYSFYFCRSIESLTIPDGLVKIGREAFGACSNLTSVTVGEGLSNIGLFTFSDCGALESVYITDLSAWSRIDFANLHSNPLSNGASMYLNGEKLIEMQIPDGITEINKFAFANCSSLESVVIPASVENIGKCAFNKATSIYFEGDAPGVYDNATANRSFHTDATLYYIPGTTGWTDSEAYDAEAGKWNGYKLEIWLERYDCEAYGHIYDDMYDLICNACGHERPIPSVPMFRMYDPNSGEHFYTGSERERDFLVTNGWNYEGVAFNFPVIGDPVYRLYNTVTGDHLYTMDLDERATLLAQGWNDEGVAFNSATPDCVPQYRLWNPNAVRGAWHFTGSERERDFLIGLGWQYQGIGWYSMLQ